MTQKRPSRQCRRTGARLTMHFYEMLGRREREALERHLAGCPACREEWNAIRRALSAIDTATAFPREAEVDWTGFARQTVARARLAERNGERAGVAARLRWWSPRSLRPLVAWSGMIAVVGMTVMIMMSRVGPPERSDAPGVEAPGPASTADSARLLQRRIARKGAARYLRDSRSLLVSLIEAPVRCRRSDGAYDLSLERERSRELLRKKNLYVGSLGGAADQRLADLVAQLESVLLQVSTFDDCTAARQIHDLRAAIDRRQILMRIDLVTRSVEGGAPRV